MEPPGSYFARLIINYARDGRIGDAYDLYEEAKRRRDTGLDCVYNAMIDAFGMNGQLGQALKTFHMVQNKTPATYEKLAKAYSLKKEVEGVVFCAKNIALLKPRRKYNVQVHLIRAFGLQRNLVSAKGAFDAVKDEGRFSQILQRCGRAALVAYQAFCLRTWLQLRDPHSQFTRA